MQCFNALSNAVQFFRKNFKKVSLSVLLEFSATQLALSFLMMPFLVGFGIFYIMGEELVSFTTNSIMQFMVLCFGTCLLFFIIFVFVEAIFLGGFLKFMKNLREKKETSLTMLFNPPRKKTLIGAFLLYSVPVLSIFAVGLLSPLVLTPFLGIFVSLPFFLGIFTLTIIITVFVQIMLSMTLFSAVVDDVGCVQAALNSVGFAKNHFTDLLLLNLIFFAIEALFFMLLAFLLLLSLFLPFGSVLVQFASFAFFFLFYPMAALTFLLFYMKEKGF